MTKEEFAAMINGRQIGNEITREEERLAKESGLLVVFGASDDLCEFRGAINDEIGAPGLIYVLNGKVSHGLEREHEEALAEYGVLESVKAQFAAALQIRALWCLDRVGPDWTYQCSAPNATFDVIEEEAVYCRGMVIEMAQPA